MSSQSAHDASAGKLQRKLMAIIEMATGLYEKAAWRANAALSVQLGRLRGQTSIVSGTFSALPLTLGKLPSSTLADLQSAIFSAPIAEFNASDHAAGYVFNPDAKAIARIFEGGYRFRRIETPAAARVRC